MNLDRYIGDRAFRKRLTTLLIPLVLQQSISSVVNLVDNVMVGQLAQESLAAVAIANQLIFVFNLALGGAVAGASIFGAQYHGQGNVEGMRHTYRYRLLAGLLLTSAAICVFLLAGTPLLQAFLHQSENSSGDLTLTLTLARRYLRISLIGLIPFAFSSALSSALRDTGETFTPMAASALAISTNTCLNFLLIFGRLGLPRLGITGAAIATVIARFVELGFLLVRTSIQRNRFPFLIGAYKSLRIPAAMVRRIFLTGTPLMISDSLWAVGTTLTNQCYSQRGLDAVSAMSISGTVSSLFAIMNAAMGSAMAIIIGQQLGLGRKTQARQDAYRLMTLNFLLHILLAAVALGLSMFIPRLYNVSPEARRIATWMLATLACILPFDATINASYCIMRSGGKMLITFLYDFLFVWFGNLLIAFCLIRFTGLSIIWVYALVHAVQVIKCFAGIRIIRSGVWLQTLAD